MNLTIPRENIICLLLLIISLPREQNFITSIKLDNILSVQLKCIITFLGIRSSGEKTTLLIVSSKILKKEIFNFLVNIWKDTKIDLSASIRKLTSLLLIDFIVFSFFLIPTFLDKGECKEFFTLMNSQEFKESLKEEPMQYLIKIGYGAHRAKGVFLLDDNKTNSLNTQYNYGAKCGDVSDLLVAQKYISNPLLLDLNNKFDFRIYMLVASTNPLIVYYHDGFLRVSVTPYDKYSTDVNFPYKIFLTLYREASI